MGPRSTTYSRRTFHEIQVIRQPKPQRHDLLDPILGPRLFPLLPLHILRHILAPVFEGPLMVHHVCGTGARYEARTGAWMIMDKLAAGGTVPFDPALSIPFTGISIGGTMAGVGQQFRIGTAVRGGGTQCTAQQEGECADLGPKPGFQAHRFRIRQAGDRSAGVLCWANGELGSMRRRLQRGS